MFKFESKVTPMEVSHPLTVQPTVNAGQVFGLPSSENADPNYSMQNTMNVSTYKQSLEDISDRVQSLVINPFTGNEKAKSRTPFKPLKMIDLHNRKNEDSGEVTPRRGQTYLPPKNSMIWGGQNSTEKLTTEEMMVQEMSQHKFKAREFHKEHFKYVMTTLPYLLNFTLFTKY
jgi:hypothetical protein